MRLQISDFAQIRHADLDFGSPGDLTVLVGQQATGKSLVLQWLKLLTDPLAIRRDWERFGFNWKTDDRLRPLDIFFGEGVGKGFRDNTSVSLDGKAFDLKSAFLKPRKAVPAEAVESTYYIPAHRALLLADGWPQNFQQHGPGTPYVARAQSERLARWLNSSQLPVFPVVKRLPDEIRKLFDGAIFHRNRLEVDRTSIKSRLILRTESDQAIPFMAWTAGQREFVPLLLALYELMPSGASSRLSRSGESDIETVILEEPELGLHPQALFAVGISMLHLLTRGYRVVVSTHSPLMVDFAWAIERLAQAARSEHASVRHVQRTFALPSTARSGQVSAAILRARARTYYLTYRDDGRVDSKDISGLRSYAPDPDEASWGELLKYSNKVAESLGQIEFDFSSGIGIETASAK
jgi:hypothetical protein